MAASSWTTWAMGQKPGYPLKDIGDNALARTFELAIQNKKDREETSVGGLGYEMGVGQKNASPRFQSRFAGDALIGGINGEFGAATNDKDRRVVQDSLLKWTEQFSRGPFGLAAPEMAGAPPPPPADTPNDKKVQA